MFSSSCMAIISVNLRFFWVKNKEQLIGPINFGFQTQSNCADFSPKVIVVKLELPSKI